MFRRVELRAAASAVLLIALGPAAPRAYGDFPACAASEEAKLIASDAQAGDYVGWTVAILGDTVVVGAPHDDHTGLTNAGSVYVFVRSGTSWIEQASAHSKRRRQRRRFGSTVALSGTRSSSGPTGIPLWAHQPGLRLRVRAQRNDLDPAGEAHGQRPGAPQCSAGASPLRTTPPWSQPKVMLGLCVRAQRHDLDRASEAHRQRRGREGFGSSVALAGDTALVGAREDSHPGTRRQARRMCSCAMEELEREQWLMASDPEPFDYFGGSVAVSREHGTGRGDRW